MVASEVTLETISEKGKTQLLSIVWQTTLGQVAAKIRGFRKPEPRKRC
jgi:ribosomal protein L6P/L9E